MKNKHIISYSCLIVILIILVVLCLIGFDRIQELEDTIENNNIEISNLNNDIARYQMASTEYYELFLNCLEESSC